FQVVDDVIKAHGKLNILVNNAARQEVKNGIEDISIEQFKHTFDVNFFSMVHFTKAALPHLNAGDSLIYTTSVNPYIGHDALIDYSSTKGAIIGLVRSVAKELAEKPIRVNDRGRRPVWSPLMPAPSTEEGQESRGVSTPTGRAGQPTDLVERYFLLASEGSAYMTGQFTHLDVGQFMST